MFDTEDASFLSIAGRHSEPSVHIDQRLAHESFAWPERALHLAKQNKKYAFEYGVHMTRSELETSRPNDVLCGARRNILAVFFPSSF